jgi:hypothetical protein
VGLNFQLKLEVVVAGVRARLIAMGARRLRILAETRGDHGVALDKARR